jgi:hypothetical protein
MASVSHHGIFIQVIDLGENAKQETTGGHMTDPGCQRRAPVLMYKVGQDNNETNIRQPMDYSTKCPEWTSKVSPFNHTGNLPCFHVLEWVQNTRPNSNKRVRKQDKEWIGLIFGDTQVYFLRSGMQAHYLPTNARQSDTGKMLQVGVVTELVAKAVMRIHVLVLPYDEIGQQGCGPESHVVDPLRAARGKMASVVAQGTQIPTRNTQQNAPQYASLSFIQRGTNEFSEIKDNQTGLGYTSSTCTKPTHESTQWNHVFQPRACL